jgi:hypothetical protein
MQLLFPFCKLDTLQISESNLVQTNNFLFLNLNITSTFDLLSTLRLKKWQ